mmetsp:Transcript_52769/g.146180  ORF Transcript_52769/g.146180 Transcript_52769/m.146180 type:complete len:114 (-) Transcript_52769:204-545(-)
MRAAALVCKALRRRLPALQAARPMAAISVVELGIGEHLGNGCTRGPPPRRSRARGGYRHFAGWVNASAYKSNSSLNTMTTQPQHSVAQPTMQGTAASRSMTTKWWRRKQNGER